MKVFATLLAVLLSPLVSAQFFSPGEGFSCNAGIATKTCVSWDSQNFDTSKEVIIPCGTCVEIVTSTNITTPQGINIQGRLRLAPPQGSKVTIRTGAILVQGILSIDTPYAPSATETVNFIMTDKGSDYVIAGFDTNSVACNDKSCNVGRRPIAVAGGRLDIKGLPATCTTWTRLKSVATTGASSTPNSTQVYKAPKAGCSLEILKDTFDQVSNTWAPFNHAWVYTRSDAKFGTYLESTNRYVAWQGISRNLDDSFMSCVDPGIPYLVTFLIKLTGANGTASKCSSRGENCPIMSLRTRINTTDPELFKEITRTNQGMIPRDNEWFPVTGIVNFTAADLTLKPYYRFLAIEGPAAGESFAVDSFSIKRAASTYFRTSDVCSELITNGKADLDTTSAHPFPLRAADPSRSALTVQKEGTNQFFRVTGRQIEWATFNVDIARACFAPQQEYSFTLKARTSTSSAVPYETRIIFYTKNDAGSDQWNGLTLNNKCATGVNQWVECTGTVTLSDPKIFQAHRMYIEARTLNDADKTVPMDFDDLSFKFTKGSVGDFVVDPNGVSGCWTPGSKVLLTSDTSKFEDRTIATIKSVQNRADGTVGLAFEETLSPRSATTDNFPIEIALLERNVKFESDNTVGIDQGGHLMVFWTKDVAQMIDGVELFKFGQRGILGRYPLHMHMCSFVKENTYIKRNLIQSSNQRCAVIHGTHGVNIEQNVVFESFGHCFMLEDGAEINNRFVGNLAASQRATEIERLVRPGESDNSPSSFWISNPLNTFIGNVAAGGEGSGYWLELQSTVKSPSVPVVEGAMSGLNLTEFRNNTAHSYRSHGLRTYSPGYRPKFRATFQGTRSYKNQGNGLFFHNSWNLLVSGGTFADNRRQIQIHRADDVRIEDVDIIGQTQSYVDARKRANSWGLCSSASSSLFGLSIHSFLFSRSQPRGPTLKNVRFFNISDSLTGCGNTSAIEMHDDEVRVQFDSWTKLENVQFDQTTVATRFSMCKAVAKGVQDVIVEVVGGVMGNGFITSQNQSEVRAFLPANTCTYLGNKQCADFCAGACLRTLRLLVDPFASESMVLEVSRGGVFGTPVLLTDSGLVHDDVTWIDNYRVYTLFLPQGNYALRFLKGGVESWPGFVRQDLLSAPSCWSASSVFTVTVAKPSATCDVIISDTVRNGNLESGSLKFWQQVSSGIQIVNPGADGSGFAAMSPKNQSSNIGQYLDSRCMVKGEWYEFTARVRSVDQVVGGSPVACDPNSNTAGQACSYANIFSEYINGTGVPIRSNERIAMTLSSTSTDSWKLIHGVFKVSDSMSKSDRAFVYVEGGPAFVQVDNMSLKKFNRTGLPIILNGNFEVGDNRFWPRGSSDGVVMSVGDTGVAIATTDNFKSIQQNLFPGAISAGKRYLFNAKYKVDGGNGFCEPETWSGDNACPKVYIDTRFDNNTMIKSRGYQLAVPPYVNTSWNLMSGYVDGTSDMVTAGSVRFYIANGPKLSKIILDDVSMTEVPRNCTELIFNGGGETGDARGWRRYGSGKLSVISDPKSGSFAIADTLRSSSSAGLEQLVDMTCMTLGTKYRISASIKLVKDGQPFNCTAVKKCPTATVESRYESSSSATKRIDLNNANATWVVGSYNQYTANFTVDGNMTAASQVAIAFRNPTEWVDMILDDVSVSRI